MRNWGGGSSPQNRIISAHFNSCSLRSEEGDTDRAENHWNWGNRRWEKAGWYTDWFIELFNSKTNLNKLPVIITVYLIKIQAKTLARLDLEWKHRAKKTYFAVKFGLFQLGAHVRVP